MQEAWLLFFWNSLFNIWEFTNLLTCLNFGLWYEIRRIYNLDNLSIFLRNWDLNINVDIKILNLDFNI